MQVALQVRHHVECFEPTYKELKQQKKMKKF